MLGVPVEHSHPMSGMIARVPSKHSKPNREPAQEPSNTEAQSGACSGASNTLPQGVVSMLSIPSWDAKSGAGAAPSNTNYPKEWCPGSAPAICFHIPVQMAERPMGHNSNPLPGRPGWLTTPPAIYRRLRHADRPIDDISSTGLSALAIALKTRGINWVLVCRRKKVLISKAISPLLAVRMSASFG